MTKCNYNLQNALFKILFVIFYTKWNDYNCITNYVPVAILDQKFDQCFDY